MEEGHFCQLCGATDVHMRCSRCHAAYYCKGKSCQKEDWPRHKRICTYIASPDAPAAAQAKSIEQGDLYFTFYNARADRTVEQHGTDTGPAMQCKSKDMKTFIEKHMGLDATQAQMMRVDMAVCGEYGRCALNADLAVRNHGGSVVHGWALFEGKYMIEAEQHTVWLPANEKHIINVTAHLASPGRSYNGYFVPDLTCQLHFMFNKRALPNRIMWK